jgi:hypothetical protein
MTTLFNLPGHEGEFTLMDDATGQPVPNWVWVDVALREYATQDTASIWGVYTTTKVSVSRVAVNWAAKTIHVNEPPQIVSTSGIQVRELHACHECCQPDACRRIHYCAAWKCGFGEVSKP